MFRFAPSPTGDMHIGNLRVALFNYIYACQEGSAMILRIEDTDAKRNIKGKEEEIKALLKSFGISFSPVIIQSENIKIHQERANKLLEEKKAFKCYCTEEEIRAKKLKAKKDAKPYRYDGACMNKKNMDLPFVLRLYPPKSTLIFKDLIKGRLCFEPKEVDSFVIMREDSTPTYNFACTVDDIDAKISVIIRGEDHVSNTPKQEHIRRVLNASEIFYAHLPIILDEDGKKMSKRQRHSSVKYLLEEGFLPAAIANYLLLLGNKSKKQIFTIEEAKEWVALSKLSKSPARFDIKMLRFINQKHLERLDPNELARLLDLKPCFAKLANFYIEEANTLKELKEKLNIILAKRKYIENKENCELIENLLKNTELPEDFEALKEFLSTKSSLKGGALLKPLRLVLSGSEKGPSLKELYAKVLPLIKKGKILC